MVANAIGFHVPLSRPWHLIFENKSASFKDIENVPRAKLNPQWICMSRAYLTWSNPTIQREIIVTPWKGLMCSHRCG